MNIWYKITVKNTYASGKSLAAIIESISELYEKTIYVILYGIEGAGTGMPILHANEYIIPTSSVIDACKQVKQFDWGDFVFVEDIDSANIVDEMVSYIEIISKSIVTVRVIDSEDFEVFTQNNNVVDKLLSIYSGSVVDKGSLEDFDYPE